MEFSADQSYGAFNLTKEKHASTALQGEGTMRVSGRWHVVGCRLAYCASSLALATLEMRVQTSPILPKYICTHLQIPGQLIEVVDARNLPEGWRSTEAYPTLQAIGMEWVGQKRSAVLAVPSAVVPEELNYIINVEHQDFTKITVLNRFPTSVDERLLALKASTQGT